MARLRARVDFPTPPLVFPTVRINLYRFLVACAVILNDYIVISHDTAMMALCKTALYSYSHKQKKNMYRYAKNLYLEYGPGSEEVRERFGLLNKL